MFACLPSTKKNKKESCLDAYDICPGSMLPPKEAERSVNSTNKLMPNNENQPKKIAPESHTNTIYRKNKLLLLSNSRKRGILNLIESTDIPTRFNFFHHSSPSGGIYQLLENIEQKTCNFTTADNVVILIGETDFEKSNDYLNLVSYIRNKLPKIKNTNVILCSPTYICGSMLFNGRVETFNVLLWFDVSNHNNACFVDSNCNLNFDMFSPYTGKLNKTGLKCIINDMLNYIKIVPPENVTSLVKSDKTFFL
ncbi:unnamed protein product [Chilo suppressalis]|uniref:Uncharacterized protein n=1 Tax=Chilo suppressalis TaxID=168631 RepID=A0ABN8BIZ8_CHISP|nr:unnamed protein product [Chilo suppressalis]